MKIRGLFIILLAVPPWFGCQSGDPAPKMIAMIDGMPPEKRPPDWEHTKELMRRRAPGVGEPAPDFTLKSPDGKTSASLSSFHADRPRVLIFGSFT